MDILNTFLPIGQNLIDNVFPTDVVYHRLGASSYDPLTGKVKASTTDYAVKAGVLYQQRMEDGGSSETHDLTLWFHHDRSGLPFFPTTGDTITYGSVVWKILQVAPTYRSAGLIASKVVARAS